MPTSAAARASMSRTRVIHMELWAPFLENSGLFPGQCFEKSDQGVDLFIGQVEAQVVVGHFFQCFPKRCNAAVMEIGRCELGLAGCWGAEALLQRCRHGNRAL